MSDNDSAPSLDEVWQRLREAAQRHRVAADALIKKLKSGDEADIVAWLRPKISNPGTRPDALPYVSVLKESVKQSLFPELARQASTGHREVGLAHRTIKTMDRQWVLEHLPIEVERILAHSSDYEEYNVLAQLLEEVGSPYLVTVVEQAAASADPDIRDVADYYRAVVATLQRKDGDSQEQR